MNRRWVLSFADLTLLLLGFIVLQHILPEAPDTASAHNGPLCARALIAASDLFEPGEAMLSESGRGQLESISRGGEGDRWHLSSHGAAAGSARFGRWELAAARMAALGHYLRRNGVAEGWIIFGEIETSEGQGEQMLILTRKANTGGACG